jgi:hypothetical protein
METRTLLSTPIDVSLVKAAWRLRKKGRTLLSYLYLNLCTNRRVLPCSLTKQANDSVTNYEVLGLNFVASILYLRMR